MRILIIDDEPLELFLAKKILSLEFQVEGFNSLPEALVWAKANSFDVLLSDYYLDKQLHATDVLKALVEIKGKTFKPFILTNYIDDNQIAQLKSAGFYDIIEKPLSLEKFKSKIGL